MSGKMRWLLDRREPETLDEAAAIARGHERMALARDLHDGLGQTLSGIAYRIAALREISPGDKLLDELDTAIRSALSQARNIAHRLDEPTETILADQLALTLGNFAALTHVPILFENLLRDPQLRCPAAHELEMILREALANAVRHSHAKAITARLSDTGSAILLEVRDDGTGLPPDHAPGFGMSSIRARVAMLQGTVAWLDANPGTLPRCTIPHTTENP